MSIPPPQPAYHQLENEFSVENFRKEAALVLAQAESHRSTAENAENIPIYLTKAKRYRESLNPKHFNSLPTRSKKRGFGLGDGRPVFRSNSDNAKKKRSTVFNLFQRKNDNNVSVDSKRRYLERSKSDVGERETGASRSGKIGSTKTRHKTKAYRSKSFKENNQNLKPNKDKDKDKNIDKEKDNKEIKIKTIHKESAINKTTPLTPIIENISKEEFVLEDCFREENKDSVDAPNFQIDGQNENVLREIDINKPERDSNLSTPNSKHLKSGILRKTPISEGIRKKISYLQNRLRAEQKMHSSQLPVQKLPLTKGKTVNGLAKRLSMERFSPPPPLSGSAFSYIRPNEGITYAQLDLTNEGYRSSLTGDDFRSTTRDFYDPELKTVTTTTTTTTKGLGTRMGAGSGLAMGNGKTTDYKDFVTSQKHITSPMTSSNQLLTTTSMVTSMATMTTTTTTTTKTTTTTQTSTPPTYDPYSGTTTIHISRSFSPTTRWPQLSPRNLSDEDEGLGFEIRKYYEEEQSGTKIRSKSPSEPPIVPKIRSISPSRELFLPLDPDDLVGRRARLESRILTRRFGDLMMNDDIQNYPRQQRRDHSSERLLLINDASDSMERNGTAYEKREQRYHRPEAYEILQKYSPERNHLDIIAPSAGHLSHPHNRYHHDYHHNHHKHQETLKNVPARSVEPLMTSNGGGHRYSKYYESSSKYYDDRRIDKVMKDYNGEGHPLDPLDRSSRQRDRYDGDDAPFISERYDCEQKSLESHLDSYHHPSLIRTTLNGGSSFAVNATDSITPPRQTALGDDHWHSSLKRDQLQQRSFDKGDSGIENDFRKESFNGGADLKTRWVTVLLLE